MSWTSISHRHGALDRLINYEFVDDSAVEARLQQMQIDTSSFEGARLWWLMRMLYTRRPLQEKMALFWHNHFVSASSKVRTSDLMLQQIQLYRDHALGNFETLLQKVTRDPAMLYYLDNKENKKGAPNENYAREVMELFTVGIGNYSEEDIKEAARVHRAILIAERVRLQSTARSTAKTSGRDACLGR